MLEDQVKQQNINRWTTKHCTSNYRTATTVAYIMQADCSMNCRSNTDASRMFNVHLIDGDGALQLPDQKQTM